MFRHTVRCSTTSVMVLAAHLGMVTTIQAQDKELGTFFTTELTAVWTAGNAESNTLGLATVLRNVWESAELKIEGGAVRSESSLKTRTAVGTTDNFQIEEQTKTDKTAEAYYFRGRYDRQIGEDFFGFAGADWLRNTFAGIDSRVLLAAGAGNSWVNSDRIRFKTDYSGTYTFQEDVVENPFVKTKFPGVRFAYDLWVKLTESTDISSALINDVNLDNTKDVRLDFTNAMTVAISSKLALKPSLQLLWRNTPSLTEVDLVATDGTPTGENVTVPLQKVDSFFKIALVVRL